MEEPSRIEIMDVSTHTSNKDAASGSDNINEFYPDTHIGKSAMCLMAEPPLN